MMENTMMPRMEFQGWNKTGFDDSKWANAELVEKPCKELVHNLRIR